MPIICPKCNHVRQPDENAPDWQCPACGVAYIKAAQAIEAARGNVTRQASHPQATQTAGTLWLGRWLIKRLVIAAIALSIGFGWHAAKRMHLIGKNDSTSQGAANGSANSSSGISEEDLRRLAATVQSGDVVMYSTTECVYCAQAKSWLNRYGFPFTECNMSVSADCEREFRSFGANGTPYLIVRGQHMKDGFDSDEFIALLKK